MRKYEIMLILPADADDKVIGGVTDRISQILAEGGGSIEKVDRWGKRRFTFEIRRQSEGSTWCWSARPTRPRSRSWIACCRWPTRSSGSRWWSAA